MFGSRSGIAPRPAGAPHVEFVQLLQHAHQGGERPGGAFKRGVLGAGVGGHHLLDARHLAGDLPVQALHQPGIGRGGRRFSAGLSLDRTPAPVAAPRPAVLFGAAAHAALGNAEARGKRGDGLIAVAIGVAHRLPCLVGVAGHDLERIGWGSAPAARVRPPVALPGATV